MLKNTHKTYGLVAIILHWLMALVVFFMFGLGLYMVDLSYYDPWYKDSLSLHKSIGLTLFFIYLCRAAWRLFNVQPVPLSKDPLERRVSHIVHIGFYLILFILMFSGYLISTADGRAIAIFGIIHIPAMSLSIANQEDIAGVIHESLAWCLMIMVALHVLAALKHQCIDKDGTIARMLWTNKHD